MVVPPLPLGFRLIALADNQLKILEHHLSQGADRGGVLVDVEAYKQDQFVVDDIIDGQQVVVGTGNHAQLVVEERHALIE